MYNYHTVIDAQLTSPGEPVCPGNRIIFTCQQSAFTTWMVRLPQQTLQQTVTGQNSPNGSVLTFEGQTDPFNFEVHVVSSTSNSSHIIITTELQVSAVRELDRVTVGCIGGSGILMSTIQIASISELIILQSLIPS